MPLANKLITYKFNESDYDDYFYRANTFNRSRLGLPKSSIASVNINIARVSFYDWKYRAVDLTLLCGILID